MPAAKRGDVRATFRLAAGAVRGRLFQRRATRASEAVARRATRACLAGFVRAAPPVRAVADRHARRDQRGGRVPARESATVRIPLRSRRRSSRRAS